MNAWTAEFLFAKVSDWEMMLRTMSDELGLHPFEILALQLENALDHVFTRHLAHLDRRPGPGGSVGSHEKEAVRHFRWAHRHIGAGLVFPQIVERNTAYPVDGRLF